MRYLKEPKILLNLIRKNKEHLLESRNLNIKEKLLQKEEWV